MAARHFPQLKKSIPTYGRDKKVSQCSDRRVYSDIEYFNGWLLRIQVKVCWFEKSFA